MKITRLDFPVPVLCIDDFLAEEEAQQVLQECIDLKKVYMPATVFDGPTATKIDKSYRDNEVVYLNEIFRGAPGRSDILRIIKRKIWTEECKTLWNDGYYIFDTINYSTWQEAVISRYGDGAFYKKHRDTRWDHITYRLVTLVYYVNQMPEEFTGGTLVLWDKKESARLEPKHNRAVVFPSFLFHEVEKVDMATREWEQGRFSLNYWMGFR